MREIDEFVSYCTGVRQLRESTAKTYQAQVENFFYYTDKEKPGDVEPKDIESFFKILREQKKSQNTQRLNGVAISKFFDWYANKSGIKSPCFGIGKIREFISEPDVPNPDEILDMIRVIDDNVKSFNQALRYRNCALIALFAETGARMGEVERLRFGDIKCQYEKRSPHHFEVSVFDTKSSNSRFIPCLPFKPGRLTEYFFRYFVWLLHDIRPKSDSPLFFQLSYPGLRVSNHARPLMRSAIQRIIQNARKKAGIDKEISAHSLRHYYATYSVINDMDIRILQYLMGHKSVETTWRYVHVAARVEAAPILAKSPTANIAVDQGMVGWSDVLKEFFKSI